MGRARIEDFRPVFIAELIPSQVAFATPLVWILGAMGLYALLRRRAGTLPARVLISTTFWTIVVYFVWHSLHARVEAHWFAPVYPAFAVAAAVAAHLVRWESRPQRAVDFCRRWAVPSGVLMFVLLVVRPTPACSPATAGMLPSAASASAGARLPRKSRRRGRGRATCILALDYATTSWLAFYLPSGTCVMQFRERIRWVNMPEPDAAQLAGKSLYVFQALLGDPSS